MPFSHHSHSGQFCKHASGTLEDVVKEAIRQKFQLFCLTEHVPRYRVQDLYPEEQGISLDELYAQFKAFLKEAHHLKALYASQITLLVGLETEFITAVDLTKVEQLLNEHPREIEFIVGSVHHVNAIPIDFDKPTFEKAFLSCSFSSSSDAVTTSSPSYFLESYLDTQWELMRTLKPEVIGHFDLCRLYTPDLKLDEHIGIWGRVQRNILYAIDYGALFEINAAAFRKGWNTAYPGPEVLQFILANKGRITLSDDSHGPHAVGLNYGKMKSYLEANGVKDVWRLRESGECNEAGRFVDAVLVEDVFKDPFWTDRE
ncbi:Polymerase/histidinol phosphatase-like protein [Schizophyllum amplum]|uniref:Histidinol-phosphatase n=1 Tax=Schizophyllum amplum TaxID=97359 RepID=A0A550CU56_9AGAR|nr:Polymerase/histidinol phosphatase-like protein [Auriculariopsis ampla]